jgi:hypothetical protein
VDGHLYDLRDDAFHRQAHRRVLAGQRRKRAARAADDNADVRAFDAVYTHILTMSDVLADGIVKQFPAKFTK